MPYIIFKSDKKSKKYMVVHGSKKIYFGAAGFMDFILWNKQAGPEVAKKRKKAYLARHQKEDWTKKNIDSPAFFARWVLWNKPTLKESLTYIRKKFNLWIINKI